MEENWPFWVSDWKLCILFRQILFFKGLYINIVWLTLEQFVSKKDCNSPRQCSINGSFFRSHTAARQHEVVFLFSGVALCFPWGTNLLNHYTEQIPSWIANQFSARQEIPHILWNPKVHYSIHECSPPFPILRSSIQSIHPHPSSWRSILILSSHLRLGFQSRSPTLRFSNQNTVYASTLPHSRYLPRPSHSSRFYHLKN